MNTKYFLSLALIFSLIFLQSCEEDQTIYEPESEVIETEADADADGLTSRSRFTANFTTSVRIFNNQAFVTFFNRSRFASTFEWSFTGASIESSTLRNPQATYSQNGTFSVTLIAKRGNKSRTITKDVIIVGLEGGENPGGGNNEVNDQEVVNVNARFFTSIRIVNNQAQVTINNRSENTESFQWSFPGGTPATSTLRNPVITYPRNGTFAITLVATNGEVSDTTTQNLSINNIPDEVEEVPEEVVDVRARFFVSVRRSNGQFSVTMRNRSTNATNFQWSFPGGNPETSTEENPTVTYTEGGTRTITLVASNGGVSSTRTVNITL